jgi:PAS domain S-box-containing protein
MDTQEKPKVLIVDDEKGLRLGTKRLLERAGYEVSAGENGTEGINLGTSEEFDLAIIDLKMPDVDGITVLKRIHNSYPNTICFIATAYASYDTAIEATKIGAFSYIPKPFTPEELLNQLKKGYEKRLLLMEAEKWRKEREERLLEVAFEKTRLNTIINSLMDGVLVVNKTGEAVLFNPSALKYLSLDNIILEEYVIDKLHPDIAALINKFLDANKYEKNSYSQQIELKPNRELFVDVTSSAVPHPDGSLAGVVIVIKDITELKKVEMLKSQFVSMVSHELKAPIAAVYGFLKLILDDSIPLAPAQQRDFLDRSMLRLDSLLKMVNDLLDISRIETKTVKREIKEISIVDILKSIIEIFQIEIDKRNLTLNFVYGNDVPVLKADYDEINRLFTNLISNSIKYNSANGKLDIIVSSSDRYLVVEIKDTGVGMKPEEKEKLFREFFRAKNEMTKNINGTGLGLSIVKRIIDSYAGKIEVESVYKEGSTFRVFLPINHNQ